MSFKHFVSKALHCLRFGVTTLALFQFSLGGPLASTAQAQSTTMAIPPRRLNTSS